MKTVGLLCLLLTGILTGRYFAKRIACRSKELYQFENFFREIRLRISYSQTPTVELLHILCQLPIFSDFSFAKYVSANLGSGKTLLNSWNDALDQYSAFSELSKEDKTLLSEFASEFGNTNEEGQKRNCDFFIERIEKIRESLLLEIQTKQKLYYAIGIFIGLFCCIVFI